MSESVLVPAVEKWTSVRVKVSTIHVFIRYGAKGDSYDDILVRVGALLECPDWPASTKKRFRQMLYPRF